MTTRTDLPAAATRPSGGLRRGADLAYGYLAAFFVLGVLVQVYLAGVGVFGINARKVANASSLDPHRAWGTVLMILAVVLLILALVAWQSARTVISTAVLAVLVTVAQVGLAAAGDSNKWVGRRARPGRHGHPAAVAVAGHRGDAAPEVLPPGRVITRKKNLHHPA